MKTFILLIFQLLLSIQAYCQCTIRGRIVTRKNEPVMGANIFIKNSFEGTISDDNGKFHLTTSLSMPQNLIVSHLGYKMHEELINSDSKEIIIQVTLYEDQSLIECVAITAGTFEAGDQKRSATLGKLDLSTSGNNFGDIYGAVRSLPGATIADDNGGLLVRGGDIYETKTFIDGLLVESPYTTKLPDIPVRGRFSPMLFRGTVFSSGGYSAEYGQALSSALILKSVALATKDETNISLFNTGALLTKVKRWENSSFSSTTQYSNMKPYYHIVPVNVKWAKAPESLNQTFTFRQRISDSGMLKAMGACDLSQSSLYYYSTLNLKDDLIALKNANYFLMATLLIPVKSKWNLFSGISFSQDIEKFKINQDKLKNKSSGNEIKLKLNGEITEKIELKLGVDVCYQEYLSDYFPANAETAWNRNFKSLNTVIFAESNIDFNKFLMARIGGRFENLSASNDCHLSPRIAVAARLSKISQVSIAYGRFSQQPRDELAIFNNRLKPEEAEHYLLNYQIEKNSRIFRVEGYYKKYCKLVKYDSLYAVDPASYSNSGSGYATGIDVFFRDNHTVKNGNFWISYSYIDTKRNYLDFNQFLTPSYIANHNINVVYKHYFNRINTYLSANYSFASGRPYIDPNISYTAPQRTQAYHNLSLSCFYNTRLFEKSATVFFQVTNLPGFKNVFGYRFSQTPNEKGLYEKIPILPASRRFFLIGIYFSLEGAPEF